MLICRFYVIVNIIIKFSDHIIISAISASLVGRLWYVFLPYMVLIIWFVPRYVFSTK